MAAYLAEVASVAATLEPAGSLIPLFAGDGTLADHTPLRYGAVGAAILFRPLSMRYEYRPTLAVDHRSSTVRLPPAVGRVLLSTHVPRHLHLGGVDRRAAHAQAPNCNFCRCNTPSKLIFSKTFLTLL